MVVKFVKDKHDEVEEVHYIMTHQRALDYTMSQLAKPDFSVSEKFIIEVHRRLMMLSEDLKPGKYRLHNVVIGLEKVMMPEFAEVPALMNRFSTWTKTCSPITKKWVNHKGLLFLKTFGVTPKPKPDTIQEWKSVFYPILYCAEVHHKFVRIHPFVDGNGRTARLLMNACLMLSNYPPIIVPVKEKREYFTALQRCSEQECNDFYNYIPGLVLRTLSYYVERLQ